jgi:carbon monoxide dehydrogenase subunit G
VISIKEEIVVPSPRDRVWEVISNPSDVVSCIAGAELGAAHDDGSFDGALVIKFGAIRVRFAARIRLELTESEFEGHLTASGGDGQGATRFRGEATFRVVEDEKAGGSRVLMTGEVTLAGKLASLVESGAGVVASRMTRDFSAKLVERCTRPAEPVGVPAEAVAGAGASDGVAPAADVPAPVAAPHRPGRLGRLRAWFARLLGRRQPPPQPVPVPDAPDRSSPRKTQTEEVGSGNTPAQ